MTLLMTIAGLALFAVAAIALWRAVQTPSFVAGLSALILSRLLRCPLKALAPRDFTAAQRQAIREGRNPFDDRPHGGHN